MTAGSRWTSEGVPAAMTLPKLSTMTRSASDITSPMSCSINSTLTPVPFTLRTSFASSSFSAGLVPAAGSSSSNSSGRVPRARAISRRRRSPKGSELASSLARGRSPTKSSSSTTRASLSFSSRRARGRRSMAPMGPVCWRDSTPIFTFSKAVSALKSLVVWNVRAMPSRFTRWGLVLTARHPIHHPGTMPPGSKARATRGSDLRPTTAEAWPWRLRKVIVPSWGLYTPVRQLKSEVLPAPLGPMTASTSPRRWLRVTSDRHVSPPKLRVTPSTSMIRSPSTLAASGRVAAATLTAQPLPARSWRRPCPHRARPG